MPRYIPAADACHVRGSVSLLIVLLFLSGFMGYRGFDTTAIVYVLLYASFACYTLCMSGRSAGRFRSHYDRCILAFILIIYCSFIPGVVWGGQTVYYSLRGAFGLLYAPIFLYIYLNKKAYAEADVKHCLLLLFVLFVLLDAYSYYTYPNVQFGQSSLVADSERLSKDYEERGVLRLFIPFEDLIALGVFYFINNPLKNKMANVIVLVVLAVLSFLRGTRSLMLATFLFAVLLYIKTMRMRPAGDKGLKAIISFLLLVVALFLVYRYTSISALFSNYSEAMLNDYKSGGDYIRWAMAGYYISMYNTSVGEYIFGHGIPVSGTFQQDVFRNANYGFYPEDIGYVELFLNFGLLGVGVLGLLLIFIISRKIKPQCYYAKYYLYYLYGVSFLGRYMLTNMILFVTMLYIVKIAGIHYKDT